MTKGLFVSFEGTEGSGKSTQARLLADALRLEGLPVLLTLEPGGTPLGQAVRSILLDPSHTGMDPVAELLLYNAARRQHLTDVVIPALDKGVTVITDRFSDSTVAYQGYGRGLDLGLIAELDRVATGGMLPDLTVLLDFDISAGLARNRRASKVMDRFELERVEFHERVRKGFIEIARTSPKRVRVVSAEGGIEDIHASVYALVRTALLSAS